MTSVTIKYSVKVIEFYFKEEDYAGILRTRHPVQIRKNHPTVYNDLINLL